MKRIILFFLLAFNFFNAQFTVKVKPIDPFKPSEAYLYSLMGSKDILMDRGLRKEGQWTFKVTKNYKGMMKVYFPESNTSLSFITENNDVELSFSAKDDKVSFVDYKDAPNRMFFEIKDKQKKKEQILPALYQIQTYYKKDSDFGVALNREINALDGPVSYDPAQNEFLDFYFKTYSSYLSENPQDIKPNNEQIIALLNTSGIYLETSSLLKPILMAFLGNTSMSNVADEVEKLLKTLDIETPRGQTVLSELIDIFNVYNIKELKEKYLKEAQALKCTINERLSKTLASNKNTAIGQKLPNTIFTAALNTKAKSLHEVKADKKVILIWSSTCSHCEKEISEMFTRYSLLKAKGVEIVGLSIDTDSKSYTEKAKILPWINDTELKGWYSSYVDRYNVHATPTFYIVDANNIVVSSPDNLQGVLQFLGIK